MKHVYRILLICAIVGFSAQTADAQWRWGRYNDFERLDTIVSIPKYKSNSLYISDNDFYLRFGFLGIELEIEDDWDRDWRSRRRRSRNVEYYEQHDHGTLKGLNFEYGLANFLDDGEFPSSSDLYQVKPIGSTFVGIGWNRISYVSGLLYLDWGGGLTWYNYKFENAATRLDPNGGQLNFVEDLTINSAIKSKLKVTYLSFTAVPMFDFGRGKRLVRVYEEDDVRIAASTRRGFRIGVGPYVGLRLSNKAKYIFKDDDGRDKVKDKGGFFINDFRYGMRLQIGIDGFDMFVNYDMNELFEDGRGPQLNPVSIGVIF
ncbi:hypothetical protein BFP97_18790 [Roseivirga sp. 4D4]|uniref:hypothetical protein n=1 Tax=Roseivirga sp. 4D4 TaxID=1889784 RepID=UPI000853634B|nr:hypothetical protein [Roseivirga sp. 4D4]OEK03440.1 hypothetical protein BFP97_18790 [Roseivirga sp. 4D4]